LERAGQNGKTIILDASPSGFPLYKTLGFEEADRLKIPLEQSGGEGTHVHGNALNRSEQGNYVSDGSLVHMIRKLEV